MYYVEVFLDVDIGESGGQHCGFFASVVDAKSMTNTLSYFQQHWP